MTRSALVDSQDVMPVLSKDVPQEELSSPTADRWSDVVWETAPAKVNLFLNVESRRADGYHELETLMVSLGLRDTLRIQSLPGEELEFVCHDARGVAGLATGARPLDLPPGPGNLVWKAAQLLRDQTGVQRGARLELWKRIPVAAGLAGGSTDAAAALRGLNRAWNLGLSLAELRELGARLGSDIPFFLAGRPAAICRGRGELITPLDLPLGLALVLVKPTEGLSTPQVFRHCRPEGRRPGVAQLVADLRRGCLAAAASQLHNTLQPAAESVSVDVVRLREAFGKLSAAGHLMSGSGSCYFGLCRNLGEARRLAGRLVARRLGSVFVTSVASGVRAA
ncbi:MAG: 4-(cytidine 5'-diphospho)-2-C-methyl-D-erythritol kinase [Planctomycetaceae bacterium]